MRAYLLVGATGPDSDICPVKPYGASGWLATALCGGDPRAAIECRRVAGALIRAQKLAACKRAGHNIDWVSATLWRQLPEGGKKQSCGFRLHA